MTGRKVEEIYNYIRQFHPSFPQGSVGTVVVSHTSAAQTEAHMTPDFCWSERG